MPFELVAYDRLKQSVKESIKSLIEHYFKSRAIDINKLTESVKLLSSINEERRIQSEFLLKIIELTGGVESEKEKTLVLNAAVYHIQAKIKETYKVKSPDGSNLYTHLATSLGLTSERQPSEDDLYAMYTALQSFLEARVFKLDEKGHLVCIDKNPFSFLKCYSVVDDVQDLNTKLYAIKQSRIERAKKEHEEALRPAVASSGLLGWFVGGPKKTEERVLTLIPSGQL